MPTPVPDPLTLPLGQRLMESVKAFLATEITSAVIPAYVAPDDVDTYVARMEAARQALVTTVFRRRDEDTVITPESDPDKHPRLLCTAIDEGRTKPYAPFRNLRLDLTIRVNALVPAGQADAFHVACGALEILLDGLNLQTALSSDTWQIAVMLATRESGCSFNLEPKGEKAVIRRQGYSLKIRAVALEHTSS